VAAVRRYVADHAVHRPAEVPPGLVAEVPIVSGGRTLGAVVLLGPAPPQAPAADVLNLAALAAVTAVALETGPAEAAARARAAVIDDIRTGADIPARELLARALGLGADLSDGAMALTARARNGRLHRAAAAVAEEFPDALSAMCGRASTRCSPPAATATPRPPRPPPRCGSPTAWSTTPTSGCRGSPRTR